VCVKAGEASAPNEVDAITGATISSKAVVKIIRERERAVAGAAARA
jgi:Na+-translocating ferredoxin:NAD+ oxidoreductase RnfG subunit